MFSINLVFVDAKTIRRLNKKYRKKDKVTTVLSFYYGPRKSASWRTQKAQAFCGMRGKRAGQANFSTECLGEIIVCPTEAKKQNIKIEDLVVHGLKSLLPQISTAKLQRT